MGYLEYIEVISGINDSILESAGKIYIIDLCVDSFKKKKKDEAYRAYITDCLQMITENTAKFAGGRYVTARFADAFSLDGKTKAKQEKEAGKIKKDLMNRINALGGGTEVGS